MSAQQVRICPVCEAENDVQILRCSCGASLLGVDFTVKAPPGVAAPAPRSTSQPTSPWASPAESSADSPTEVPFEAATEPTPELLCPYSDCAQPNPAGLERCLYCNRALLPRPGGAVAPSEPSATPGRLPVALRQRYRELELPPTAGAEADLLLVECTAAPPNGERAEQRIVKLYRRGLAGDETLLAKLAQAGSGHVVRIFEHGESDGVRYEVMEYCPLGNLRTLLATGPMSVERIRAVVSELSQALEQVQALHILHRDLKPENVLVRSLEPLSLVLTDFGIASLRIATQHFTDGARTTRYAAPEALTGVLDDKADWWSLGMIVLEAVAGRHPFEGLNEQVANYHLATKPVDTRGVFHDELRKLCSGLLLRDPKRRWGAPEVKRWLAADATLPMPQESALNVALRPYQVGEARCTTAVELAATLAKNWQIGCKDLTRGSVAAWVDGELHDHNLLRKLQDIMDTRGVSPDWRLLSFMLAAAPDMPAVWQAQPVSRQALLIAARKSTLGDAKSTAWLQSIHAEGVLELLADAGRDEVASFRQHWLAGLQRFEALWNVARAAEDQWSREPKAWHGKGGVVVDVAYALYVQPVRMAPPGVERRHGAVMLAINLPAYVGLVRTEVQHGLASHEATCPWLAALGPLADLDPVGVMVAKQLLPLAQEDMAREAKYLASTVRDDRVNPDWAMATLSHEVASALNLARLGAESAGQEQALQAALESAQAACLRVVALPAPTAEMASLRNAVETLSRAGMELQTSLDGVAELRGVNAIWLKPDRLLVAVLIAVSLGTLLPGWVVVAGLGALGVAVAWRRTLMRNARDKLRTRLGSFIRFGDKVMGKRPPAA